MPRQGLKLKQASAVLQIEPKELQNLVQFGVVKPRRLEGTYFFDANALMVAKVASYLKESLGTRTSVLSKLMEAFSASEEEFKSENPKYIIFNCRLAAEEEPIKLGVPFRAFGEQIEERMSRADLYKDLPRGKKRRGWKKEFLESLTEAAKDIGEVSEEEILRTVRSYRKEKACAGDHRCRRKLGSASHGPSLTQVCLWLAYRASESRLFPAGIRVPMCFTLGRAEQFRLAHNGGYFGRVQGSSEASWRPSKSYRNSHQPDPRASRRVKVRSSAEISPDPKR